MQFFFLGHYLSTATKSTSSHTNLLTISIHLSRATSSFSTPPSSTLCFRQLKKFCSTHVHKAHHPMYKTANPIWQPVLESNSQSFQNLPSSQTKTFQTLHQHRQHSLVGCESAFPVTSHRFEPQLHQKFSKTLFATWFPHPARHPDNHPSSAASTSNKYTLKITLKLHKLNVNQPANELPLKCQPVKHPLTHTLYYTQSIFQHQSQPS